MYDSRNDCNAIIESETNTLVLGCNYSVIPETVERIKLLAFTKPIGLTRSIITVSDKIKRSFLLHNYLEELNDEIRLEENAAYYGCPIDDVFDPLYDPLWYYHEEKRIITRQIARLEKEK